MINGAWNGRSYREAGFACKKSFRNARWAIRRIARAAGMVVPRLAPPIPLGDPFEPLEQTLNKYDKPAVGHFVAWCRQLGLWPPDVKDPVLIAYQSHLMTHMVGKRPDHVIRLIARLWNDTARREPSWPQTKLSAPSLHECYTLPFTAYPLSFQNAVAALAAWMSGTRRRTDPGRRAGRKRAMRPATVKLHLYSLRSAAWALVAEGWDPVSITDLDCLITNMETILVCYEERARTKQQALPEADRVPNPLGTTAQTHNIGKTLVMIAKYREVSSETLKALKALAAEFRVPPLSKPTLKNRRRIDQFLNDRTKLKDLMRLPRKLMDEALALRDQSSEALRQAGQTNGHEAARLTHKATGLTREAAYRAREAVAIGILCRIPLRIKNLHEIRIGTNLQFAGGDSTIVTLCFTEAETKNVIDLQFYVGPRLYVLLRTYIDFFLAFFAAKSADFDENHWLFPSGGHLRGSGPLSIDRLREIIVRTVAENVGATINPHLFRALAVALALEHSPDALEHCRQLLGDNSLTIVLRHYSMMKEMEAARRQSSFVDAEEDRLARAPAPRPLQRVGRRP
jgi:integrase